MLDALTFRYTDWNWWADNIAGYVVFTIMTGLVIMGMRRLGEQRYHGWRLELVEHAGEGGREDAILRSDIYWQDLERILSSETEKWRYVRHLVGGYARISTASGKEAEQSGWLEFRPPRGLRRLLGGGSVRICLPRIPPEQLIGKTWFDGKEPRGWIGRRAATTPRRALFVSAHAGAVEWARRQGIEAEAKTHLGDADIAALGPGDMVIGTLPISLVAALNAKGARYRHLVLDLGETDRRKPLSADDMARLGARLVEYTAAAVD